MLRRRRLALAALPLIGLILAGATWLLGTTGGLHAAARLAGHASGGRLHIEAVSGRLAGPLAIGQLRWRDSDWQIAAEGLRLDWSPAALWHREWHVDELQVERLRISIADSTGPTPPPADLRLPLAIRVDKLLVAQLHYGEHFAARDLAGRLSSDGRAHVLDDFYGQTADVAIAGRLSLDGLAPFVLAGRARLTGQLEGRPLAIALEAAGPLERIALQAVAAEGLVGRADALLTPFAEAFFSRARLQLDALDPAAWWAGAPAGRLTAVADLLPLGNGVAGSFGLTNHQPGPLDRQRLPLTTLSGSLEWQGDELRLPALHAALLGNGELKGDGRWQGDALQLTLTARRLDGSQLATALRPTRLSGPLSASLGRDRQSLRLDLQQAAYRLQADALLAAGRLEVSQLQLTAGDARLAARGELHLGGARRFVAQGELRRFDPSRFARSPAASINADWHLAGQIMPNPAGTLRFNLPASRLAGLTLDGEGSVTLDWPRLPKANIQLRLGANRLLARGAFGQPEDRLEVDLDAPQLAPLGLDGTLNGHLALSGGVANPALNVRMTAGHLALPGTIRLNGLTLAAELGSLPASPLALDIRVAGIDRAEGGRLLSNIRINGAGRTASHRVQVSGELADRSRLTLGAEGEARRSPAAWQGLLNDFRLESGQSPRRFALSAPAPLAMTATAWRLGPARLASDALGWQATLHGEADARRLSLRLQANGRRIGRLDGDLLAGMRSPWELDEQAPWQGGLRADMADLSWLAELVGDGWRSAGQIKGEFRLAGTPAHPLGSGQLRGERLALRLPDQGLDLVRGELDVGLRDDRLSIHRLDFESMMQALPRPLNEALGDEAAALTARPGRLAVSGEVYAGQTEGLERAALDIQLDRFAALQAPDRWIAVSGKGRINWQDGALGVRGKLAVDAGYWQFAPGGTPQLSDDVVIRRRDAEALTSGLRPKIELDVTTDLGRHFIFSGAGLNSRLSGEVRVSARGRDLPRASGAIRTRGGRFEAYGQKLAIERGVLTFNGLLDNPGLDVRAVRKGLPVEAGVQVGGTARKPVVRLISEPDLPEAEKLSWLILGHGPEQMGSADAAVLLSAAGGLLGNDSGTVLQQLKTTFGVDEFGIRQGSLGDNGSRQPTSRIAGSTADTSGSTGQQILSVGKRLSSNALLAYEQTLGKTEGIVKLTVNLTRQIAVIGRAGSENALDVFYTLSFGRAQERPARPAP